MKINIFVVFLLTVTKDFDVWAGNQFMLLMRMSETAARYFP